MNSTSSFLEAMDGVKPLKDSNNKVIFTRKVSTDKSIRRQYAEAEDIKDPNFLSLDQVDIVKPDDVLAYKKDGVQQGVFKNLRLGKYQIQAVLTLHGMKVKEAREAVFNFIKQSQQNDARSILIKHGKGLKSEPQAILKSYINKWVREFDSVLAFHSCLPQHGGNGAIYALLKKSDEARLHNKERHQKRGENK